MSSEVIATFYYTLTDSNGGRTHRADASVATYEYDMINQIKQQFEQAIQIVNDPNTDQTSFNTAVATVITGVGAFFDNFRYHEVSTIPLTNSNWEPLSDSVILWDGARVEPSADGQLPAIYKEDGNLTLPDGSIHVSQIYPDSGTGFETSVPQVVFNVTGGTGAYDGINDCVLVIDYDNDGTVLGDGSRKRLRKLRLVRGDYTQL